MRNLQLMINKAALALQNAYAPYSNYQVAACIMSSDDKIFTGVNVENCSYGLTLCAEASAICQMISSGSKTIQAMVIMNGENTLCPPCGACRQRISEFTTSETIIHLCHHNSVIQSIPFKELLPLAFQLKR